MPPSLFKVIRWLCENGANPNSIGRYGRTPLYRAAFAGKEGSFGFNNFILLYSVKRRERDKNVEEIIYSPHIEIVHQD